MVRNLHPGQRGPSTWDNAWKQFESQMASWLALQGARDSALPKLKLHRNLAEPEKPDAEIWQGIVQNKTGLRTTPENPIQE